MKNKNCWLANFAVFEVLVIFLSVLSAGAFESVLAGFVTAFNLTLILGIIFTIMYFKFSNDEDENKN